MFGHHDVANHHETVAAAHLFQSLEKQSAASGRAQQGTSAIATGSDEMQVAGTVVSLETFGHGKVYGEVPTEQCDG